MAEIAVSAVVGSLGALMVDEGKLSGIREEIYRIKDELESILPFLRDADLKADTGEINHSVKQWVKQVRDVADRLENVVDEYIFHLMEPPKRRGLTRFFHRIPRSIVQLKRRHRLISQIQEIKRELCFIREASARYAFNTSPEQAGSSSWHDTPLMASFYMQEEEVIAMESLKEQLTYELVEGDSNLTVVSLVGMGGVGKTTLAKIVYDSPTVRGHFECCAWINFSQSYNDEEQLRTMIEQFNQRAREQFVPNDVGLMEKPLLIDNLRRYLQPKRYVVVLDDIWDREAWKSVSDALPDCNKGSRVIITTRNGDIASQFSTGSVLYLRPLPADQAWQLFCRRAFQYDFGGTCPAELEDLSHRIVNKCEGLPLAIVTIAGLLSRREKVVFEWQKLYNDLQMNPYLTFVTKIILLSYHALPLHLKYCFLYLSIMPEGYSIRCARLIRLWIAEGFVQAQQGRTLEEVAEAYLTELVNRNLIQVSEVSFESRARSCTVHDLMHDLIVSKSKEENFCHVLEDYSSNYGHPRRLSVHKNAYILLQSIDNPTVRSCFLFGVDDQLPNSFLGKLFAKFKILRVLDLEDAPLDYLPKELGTLIHLRYLGLRNTKVKVLPTSIGNLYNLQTLDLKFSLVHELPIEICGLLKLRNLLACNFDSEIDLCIESLKGVKIDKGIGRLEELQKLHDVDANHVGASLIKELKQLSQLRKLGITKLTRENGRALGVSIKNMIHLNTLSLRAINEHEILDLEAPPQYLRCLYLYGRLEKLPDWIIDLHNLIKLRLYFSRLTDNPIELLQSLPNLLCLELHQGYDGDGLYFGPGGFLRLKRLHLTDLARLNSVVIEEAALPLLEELSIGPSPRLKEVPPGIRHLRKLRDIGFVQMPREFMDRIQPVGKDYYIVQHVPTISARKLPRPEKDPIYGKSVSQRNMKRYSSFHY